MLLLKQQKSIVDSTMIEWWSSLSLELKIFYGIGIVALLVVTIQMLMTLFGFDTDGLDGGFDVDFGDGYPSSSGIGLFSTQTLAAFFLAFGWTGVALLKGGTSVFVSALIAAIFGFGAMLGMFYMIRKMLKLQSKGNLDYSSAIGEEATVYVTVPGDNQDGGGQIQVMIQGRLTVASARRVDQGALKPGQRVRVVGTNSPSSFLVETL